MSNSSKAEGSIATTFVFQFIVQTKARSRKGVTNGNTIGSSKARPSWYVLLLCG